MRARNVKPGLFTNEILCEYDPWFILLFEGIWLMADREGRLLDNPAKIKRQLFPTRKVNVEKGLTTLAEDLFIKRYVVENTKIIQILNWKKHQSPHVNEGASTLPAPPKEVQEPGKHRTNPSDSLIPDSLIPDSKQLRNAVTIGSNKDSSNKTQESLEFEKAWQIYPTRPGRSKEATLKAWKARINEGHAVEEMLRGAERYALYVKTTNTDPQYIKLPATFFGPGKHFLADWKVQNRQLDWANKLTGKNDDGDTIDI